MRGYKIIYFLLLLPILWVGAFAYAQTWQDPTDVPPNGNIYGPVWAMPTTSAAYQDGSIRLQGSSTLAGVTADYAVFASTNARVLNAFALDLGDWAAYFGNPSTPATTDDGKIYAKKYCIGDTASPDCITAWNLSGGNLWSQEGATNNIYKTTAAGIVGVGTGTTPGADGYPAGTKLVVKGDATNGPRVYVSSTTAGKSAEMDLQLSTSPNDHWGIYANNTTRNLSLWSQDVAGGIGDNRFNFSPDGVMTFTGYAPPSFTYTMTALTGGLASGTLNQGGTLVIAVTNTAGTGTQPALTFSVSGLPTGVSSSFTPTTCTPTCTSNLTLTATGTATLGTSNIIVTSTGGGAIRTASYNLTVQTPPPFDFTLGTISAVTLTQGASTTRTVTATLTSGSTTAVTFSATGTPSGATITFSPTSCNPTCSTTMTVNSGTANPGTSTITVTAAGTGATHATTFSFTISPPAGSYILTIRKYLDGVLDGTTGTVTLTVPTPTQICDTTCESLSKTITSSTSVTFTITSAGDTVGSVTAPGVLITCNRFKTSCSLTMPAANVNVSVNFSSPLP